MSMSCNTASTVGNLQKCLPSIIRVTVIRRVIIGVVGHGGCFI